MRDGEWMAYVLLPRRSSKTNPSAHIDFLLAKSRRPSHCLPPEWEQEIAEVTARRVAGDIDGAFLFWHRRSHGALRNQCNRSRTFQGFEAPGSKSTTGEFKRSQQKGADNSESDCFAARFKPAAEHFQPVRQVTNLHIFPGLFATLLPWRGQNGAYQSLTSHKLDSMWPLDLPTRNRT